MNINDVYIDQAMLGSVVIPTIAGMASRAYPREIQERLARLKLETDSLSVDLVRLVDTLRTPKTPGIPGIDELPA
jgi:hypothetical protein